MQKQNPLKTYSSLVEIHIQLASISLIASQ